jgi:hypothetical protein
MEENSLLHQRTRAEGILEGYLASLATSLAPVESGFGEEARRHILEYAGAYEELGHDPLAAMRSAIEQFGNPREIAHAMANPAPARNEKLVLTAVLALAWGSAVGGGLVLIALNGMYWLRLYPFPAQYPAFTLGILPGFLAALMTMKSKLSPIVAAIWTGFFFGGGILLLGAIVTNRSPFWNPVADAFAIFLFGVGFLTYWAVAWFLSSFRGHRRFTT